MRAAVDEARAQQAAAAEERKREWRAVREADEKSRNQFRVFLAVLLVGLYVGIFFFSRPMSLEEAELYEDSCPDWGPYSSC